MRSRRRLSGCCGTSRAVTSDKWRVAGAGAHSVWIRHRVSSEISEGAPAHTLYAFAIGSRARYQKVCASRPSKIGNVKRNDAVDSVGAQDRYQAGVVGLDSLHCVSPSEDRGHDARAAIRGLAQALLFRPTSPWTRPSADVPF